MYLVRTLTRRVINYGVRPGDFKSSLYIPNKWTHHPHRPYFSPSHLTPSAPSNTWRVCFGVFHFDFAWTYNIPARARIVVGSSCTPRGQNFWKMASLTCTARILHHSVPDLLLRAVLGAFRFLHSEQRWILGGTNMTSTSSAVFFCSIYTLNCYCTRTRPHRQDFLAGVVFELHITPDASGSRELHTILQGRKLQTRVVAANTRERAWYLAPERDLLEAEIPSSGRRSLSKGGDRSKESNRSEEEEAKKSAVERHSEHLQRLADLAMESEEMWNCTISEKIFREVVDSRFVYATRSFYF